jgi:cytochrome o ubiquinol oxidase subunit 1
VGLLTYKKKWKWIWNEWLTTVDHKKIGFMYLSVTFLMLVKGVIDAFMMRAQQAMAVGESYGYLGAEHFQQVFTAHGATMIFFVAMGAIFGLFNLVVPLQIGARDVAYPFLNALSFWLFVVGAALVNISLVIGEYAGTGWLAYPPLSGLEYSPGVGVDYWIWSVQIAGFGSLLAGINFFVTILKMRCKGMTMMRMPMFTWTAFAAIILVIFAFPILTATLGLLTLDRVFEMKFFTTSFGGNPMMYINLIWAWGHPEVYILMLPAFGIFSEVVPTFCRKPLFGYTSMVWAIVMIAFLSFIVWLHHFFTMGSTPKVNAFFGIMTMLVAIPTGVKIFNWLFTEFRGKIHFTTPMLWFTGFVVIFTIGGMAGVLLSVPPVDFQAHNSLFLVAHFHSVIIGGVLFGFFAGYTYWFPKVTGFRLNERIGRYAFLFWFCGFLLAFLPLYVLGFMGATRRLNHYSELTGWQPYFIVAGIGVTLIIIGLGLLALQLIVSIKKRHAYRDKTGDPWDGRTLEWSIPSPPPIYNFAIEPVVEGIDAFWAMKHEKNKSLEKPHYEAIHMPKNTPTGLFVGALSLLFSFSVIWHIYWLALVAFILVIICLIVHLSNDDVEFTISAEEVEKIEAKSRQ